MKARNNIPGLILKTVVCLLAVTSSTTSLSAHKASGMTEGIPFEIKMPSRPAIGHNSVVITDFKAVGDGVTLNTEAFREAVEWLSSRGGGRLSVPPGVWLTGPIELKSNIELHISPGAIILFSPDRNLYPIINTNFEGLDCRRCESPIHADGAHDIAITGGGVIDGNGDAWRAVKKSKLTPTQWKEKIASGGILNEKKNCWYPDAGFMKAEVTANMNVPDPSLDEDEIKSFLRPVMISIRNCENVLLKDCTFQNSPCWNIHTLYSDGIVIRNITVRNPAYAQNGDGLDIDACRNVLVLDSTFDCGDDGICVKSGKDEDGRRHARACENLVISGCTVYRGHGGFVVGSEMSGGVRNILVKNCRFLGTDVGLRFKSKRGRGGVVENIRIKDITMSDIVTDAILFDLFYGGKSAVEARADGNQPEIPALPVDETTPAFRNIHISGIRCSGAERAMLFNGLPEMPVRGIDISDCLIHSRRGIEIHRSEDVTLENVSIFPEEGEAIYGSGISGLKISSTEDLPLSQKVVAAEMRRSPDGSHLDSMNGKLKWNYTTGLELKAFLDCYERYGGDDILKYVDEWYDRIIDGNGSIKANYKKGNYVLDHICPGRTLFQLYDLTGKEKYRKAIDTLRLQLSSQPRTAEGGFWHKKSYPEQMWLDGLYMAEPFYAEYTARYDKDNKEAWKDITKQFLLIAEKTFDPATGLYRHAWDSSESQPWADRTNGQSMHCWGRALGWYLMAVTETLPLIPKGTPGRNDLLKLYKSLIGVLPRYADPQSGMWYQVLDCAGREGNYTEATASAMIIYSMLLGSEKGLLDKATGRYAVKCYGQLLDEFVRADFRGDPDLVRCCAVAGLGGKENRAGDYNYYINERICSNDPKGIGPLIWASLIIEK